MVESRSSTNPPCFSNRSALGSREDFNHSSSRSNYLHASCSVRRRLHPPLRRRRDSFREIRQRVNDYFVVGEEKYTRTAFGRVLHDAEMGGVRQEVLTRGKSLPEVFQPLSDHNPFSPLTKAWQLLWKNLNPQITNLEWRQLLHWQRAFTNNNGFERPGDPRRDYVNQKDLTAPLPKIECLLCGGALVSIVRETVFNGEEVYELDVLNGRKSPPPLEWVLRRPWLFYQAVSVSVTGIVRSFSISPYPEYVPFISLGLPVYMPKKNIKILSSTTRLPPNPYYP